MEENMMVENFCYCPTCKAPVGENCRGDEGCHEGRLEKFRKEAPLQLRMDFETWIYKRLPPDVQAEALLETDSLFLSRKEYARWKKGLI